MPTVSAEDARRLFLGAQCMLDDPSRPATAAGLRRLVRRMGFVQIDTINILERAHHLILASRLDAYRPPLLARLLEDQRTLFEHWTHDAAAIPVEWFHHWHHRFKRYRRAVRANSWWRERIGARPHRIIRSVMQRIEREGPLLSRDFEPEDGERPRAEEGWWGWKPQKAALEYLWRCGELAIVRRVNFQKVYDLTSRVLAQHSQRPASTQAEHVDWACRTALDRLGTASPREIARFWNAIDIPTAANWCRAALKRGEVESVLIEGENGAKPQAAFAPADWRNRLAAQPPIPARVRLLCPFDPIIRDRPRTLRLFGFDYRFEAFVPAAKRKYGYYVLPAIQGNRLIARLDLRFNRRASQLEVKGIWWEAGVRANRMRRLAVDEALQRLCRQIGAQRLARVG